MHPDLRSVALLTLTVGLAACGGTSTDGAAAPESVPFAATEPTDAPTTTAADTTSSTGATESAGPAGDLVIDAEMLTAMLATEQGRALIVGSMADMTGLEPAAAECFVDQVDVTTVVALSSLGPEVDPAAISPEAQADLQEALAACGIAPETLLGATQPAG